MLGAVEIYCADNNSKIVCYYDSRSFAKEGKVHVKALFESKIIDFRDFVNFKVYFNYLHKM